MHQYSLRFDCPPLGDDRIGKVHRSIERWVRASDLSRLVECYGAIIPQGLPYAQLVAWLLEFAGRWDFRRLQQQAAAKDTGENARWLVDAAEIVPAHRELVFEAARALGLAGCEEPALATYDYVLVLGGARLSCLLRPRLAAHLISSRGLNPRAVVLLASSRPISATERDATDTYAADARTEYDLINRGAVLSFGLDSSAYTEDEYHDPDNTNRSWAVRRYGTARHAFDVIAISAPSSDPDKRRANSVDTYEFFMSRFGVAKGSALLLVTSQIYAPYQQLEALRTVAIPHNLVTDTVGFPPEWGGELQGMLEPTNYLQEIRSTVQSADRFINTFPPHPR